jgi:hypothetical protein
LTQISEKEFLEKLSDVVGKLISIARAQGSRFEKLWEDLFSSVNEDHHKMRDIKFIGEKFLKDIDYRIEILKSLEISQIDGFYCIKSILETLYNYYFDSDLFRNNFSKQDQLLLKYIVAREILGTLIQFNQLDHETVPLKYNIIGRNYLLIKLNGQKDVDILQNMVKLNINIELAQLNKILDEVVSEGIVNKTKTGNNFFYTLNKELELTEIGKKQYNAIGLRQIVEWPTQFWRSFYNIRELNVTIDENAKYRDFLHQILAKSATQGFTAANYVFKNLIKYYEKIKEEL